MKKNGLFTGWKNVFSFTAAQNIKGTGYRATTIILGLIIAVAFSIISIVMAVTQSDEDTNNDIEDIGIESEFGSDISDIYLVDNEVIADEGMKQLVITSMSLEGALDKAFEIKLIKSEERDSAVQGKDNAIVIELSKEDDINIVFNIYLSDTTQISDVAEEYVDYVISYIDVCGYGMAGVSPENIRYFTAPYFTQALSVNDSVESFGVMITAALVPMLFSLLMYSMILLHGQSITKSVVAEKSSKLMEMMLTSVKPYALIAGKIIAVATMAIGQMFIWIVCGFAGYKIGGIIAEEINPGYVNYVDTIIDLMSVDNGAHAFSLVSVVIAIAALIVGFFMYSVLAGLVSASVDKLENISTAMSLFQIPVIIGWLVAYFSSFIESDLLLKAVHLVPVTSPFILPADVIIGKCSIIEGIASLLILIVSTIALILVTGKVYKGKLFNRS